MRKSDLNNKKKCVHRKPHCGRSGFEKNSLRNQGETRRSVAKGEPLRKAISAARREVRENGPQIKLGLLRPAGKFPSLGAKPRQSAKKSAFAKNRSSVPHSRSLSTVPNTVSSPGRQPSAGLGLAGPTVEGMRWKPAAILPQTDGHRKPTPRELSRRRSCPYGRSIPGGRAADPKTGKEKDKPPAKSGSNKNKGQYEPV